MHGTAKQHVMHKTFLFFVKCFYFTIIPSKGDAITPSKQDTIIPSTPSSNEVASPIRMMPKEERDLPASSMRTASAHVIKDSRILALIQC